MTPFNTVLVIASPFALWAVAVLVVRARRGRTLALYQHWRTAPRLDKLRCHLGIHRRHPERFVPERVWYIQRRSDAGSGPLSEQCPLCLRWHRVSEQDPRAYVHLVPMLYGPNRAYCGTPALPVPAHPAALRERPELQQYAMGTTARTKVTCPECLQRTSGVRLEQR